MKDIGGCRPMMGMGIHNTLNKLHLSKTTDGTDGHVRASPTVLHLSILYLSGLVHLFNKPRQHDILEDLLD